MSYPRRSGAEIELGEPTSSPFDDPRFPSKQSSKSLLIFLFYILVYLVEDSNPSCIYILIGIVGSYLF